MTTVEPHFNEHSRDQGFLFAGVGSVRSPGFPSRGGYSPYGERVSVFFNRKSVWDQTKSFIQVRCSPEQSVRKAGFYCIFFLNGVSLTK